MSKPLNVLKGSAVHTLLLHLASCPNLSAHLRLLHDLALYESGGALLGPDEKEALLNAKELAVRLEGLSEDELCEIRAVI